MSGELPDDGLQKPIPSVGLDSNPPKNSQESSGKTNTPGDPSVDAKKKTFAESVITDKTKTSNEVLNKYQVKAISWADLVEADEIDEATKRRIDAARTDLLRVIRNKSCLATENRILVPYNMKTELPLFYDKLVIAAQLADCDLVEDKTVKIELARKQIFGTDEAAREASLITLYNENGQPKPELVAIADFTVLMNSVLEIPDPEEMGAPLGRAGVFHTFALFMRTYCEQKFDTPISKQKNWWKGGNAVRKDMIQRIQQVVGGEFVATCIMNCFDILYRKFIRSVFAKGNPDRRKTLDDLAQELSEKLYCSGAGLFQNLLRVETRSKKTIVDVLKKGKNVKETREEKYLARVKPTILDGPKTTLEQTVLAKVNTALAKTDTLAEGYTLKSKLFESPVEWESEHQSWVESLYSKAKVASNEMVRRKQKVRALIKEHRAKASAAPGTASTSTDSAPIQVEEWRKAQEEILSGCTDELQYALEKALECLFGKFRTLAEYLDEPEDALLHDLGPDFYPDENVSQGGDKS